MDAGAGKKNILASVGLRISALVGVLSAFNLVAHKEELVQFSQSVKYLHQWWAYLTSVLYAWVPFHLPEQVRDTITIVGIALGAASTGLYRESGETIPGFVRRIVAEGHVERGTPGIGLEAPSDAAWFVGILLSTLLFVLFTGNVVGLSVLAYLAVVGLLGMATIRLDLARRLPALRIPLLVLITPAVVVLLVFLLAARFRRVVGKTAGVVLLLLAANWLFAHVVDPLLPLVERLPRPPPQL